MQQLRRPRAETLRVLRFLPLLLLAGFLWSLLFDLEDTVVATRVGNGGSQIDVLNEGVIKTLPVDHGVFKRPPDIGAPIQLVTSPPPSSSPVTPPTSSPTSLATASPTNAEDVTRDWFLYPRPNKYISSQEIYQKPLCKHWNRYLCWTWVDSAEQFARRKTQVEVRAAAYKAGPKTKCPKTVDDVVTVWMRNWPPDWNDAYNGKMEDTTACPQKCVSTRSRSDDAAIVVDTNEIREAPPRGMIQAMLELEDHQHETGVDGRNRHMHQADILVSWSRQADVWITYMYAWAHWPKERCEIRQDPRTMSSYQEFLDKCLPPLPTLEELKNNQKDFIVGFVSNCGDNRDATDAFLQSQGLFLADSPTRVKKNGSPYPGTHRSNYIKEFFAAMTDLKGRQAVNYGSCHRNGQEPSGGKPAIMSKFKFSMAFENTIRQDYLTEKLFQAVVYGTIPVVFGPPETGQLLPGGDKSYINALDFDTPQALAKFLIELDQDHERYLEYFKWRKDATQWNPDFWIQRGFNFVGKGRESLVCRICSHFSKQWCGLDIPTTLPALAGGNG